MRRRVLASVLSLCLSVCLTSALAAATLQGVIPVQAPHGARVVITGTGLDDPQIAVAFSGAGGDVIATIVVRTATEIEARVPETAITGPIRAGSASASFTVGADPGFANVVTLAASNAAHDLLKQPSGAAIDPRTGTVFVADTLHHQIVSIANGTVAVIAGAGKPGNADGAAATAQFKQPTAVAWDALRGVLYIADSGNHVIRRLSPDGAVSTFAGSGHPGLNDGIGFQASFSSPAGIAIDADGNLFVADAGNNAIRLVTPQGQVTTLAGGSHPGYADGAAAKALFSRPEGVAVSLSGTVYVADTGNHRVRAISGGLVTTVAGTGHPSLVDGANGIAEFKEPSALSVDDAGAILVADRGNSAVRVINASGFVATIASQTMWKAPAGIANEGAIVVSDAGNDSVRAIYRTLTASALYPRVGPPAGGNVIRLFGTGFVPGATNVTFGSAATQVVYVTSTELLVTVPAGITGSVDVRVDTPAGSVTLTGAYTTFVPPPTITSVTPRKGPTAGGQTLAISGTNFINGETQVTIGGLSAAVVAGSSTTLSATTPPGTAGAADIVVITSGGSDRLAGGFTYFAPPTISSFAPSSGRAGTSVTISGTNFDSDPSGDQVTINGLSASVTSATATSLVVIVPPGATSGAIRITTAGGTVQSSAPFAIVTVTSLDLSTHSLALTPGDHQQLTANAIVSDGGSLNVTSQAVWSTSNPAVVTVDHGLVAAVAAGQATITASYSGFNASASVIVTTVALPPDPATVAPPLNLTQVTPFASSYAFLFNGPSPIQTGVAANAFDPLRTAVIRGVVRSRDGAPLPAVRVTIAGHPEFGQTLSRADGQFDLAVNGGAPMTVHYERSGYFPAERRVATVWQDFAIADDVALVTLDANSTTVTAGANAPQVARGTTTNDERGSRTATLIFPAGVTASMTMPDGSSLALTTLTVRATEYTVGANGPMAMPATLPPSSQYTYCAEFSVDEALAAGATGVVFSKPVAAYVDNFLGFPAGIAVPTGYYDRLSSQWRAMDNGRVIKIVNIANGAATIDIDGDGVADDATKLATLGIDANELQTLATLYVSGQTLWRMSLPHFSAIDGNWPWGPPADARKAQKKPRRPGEGVDDPTQCAGSIIDCQNQVLGEAFDLAGTTLGLRYSSASQPGGPAYRLDIAVTDSVVPASMTGAIVRIGIAGQLIVQEFPALPDQHYVFVWNGRDGYDRPVQGERIASVDIGYKFKNAKYESPAAANRAFGLWSGTALDIGPFRQDVTLWAHFESSLGTVDPKSAEGLGGWTLTAHHYYDPLRKVLHLGTGESRHAEAIGNILNTAAGNGTYGSYVEGAQATATALSVPYSITPAPDGSFYITEDSRILRVDRDGTSHTFGGTGTAGFSGDGGPATSARISASVGALGPDGSFYFVDGGKRIRCIRSGIVTTIATSAIVTAVAVGPDNSVYLTTDVQILKVMPDGQLSVIAGAAIGVAPAEGVIALNARFRALQRIAVGPDESIYFTDLLTAVPVFRITPDGILHVVAGTTNSAAGDRDGVAATSVYIASSATGIDVAHDGTVYFAGGGDQRIRAVRPDGIITTVAGGGRRTFTLTPDNTPALGAPLNSPNDVKVAPDGTLLVAAVDENAIKRILPPYPAAALSSELIIASQSGNLAYVFDSSSRHLKTVNTMTGVTLLQFGYDSHGFISNVTDRDGQMLQVERATDGTPTAIVAPGGQRTGLVVDARGYLSSVTDPGGEVAQVTHADGLLTSLTTPRGFTHTYTYDNEGHLTVDRDPAGGATTLTRSGTDAHYTVTRTTAEGRMTRFEVDNSSTVGSIRTSTGTNGLSMRTSIGGDQKISATTADGVLITGLRTANARFGMQAATAKSATIKTPSGLTLTLARNHAVVLGDANNPLSLLSRSDTTSFNGRTFSHTFSALTRQSTLTTPVGRTVTATLNQKGRLAAVSVPGVTPSALTYDDAGHLIQSAQGSRLVTYSYDAANHLTSVRDALGRTATFDYEADGRLTHKTLFDGRRIAFTYDTDGDLTSVTPPGRPAHLFTFTPIDQGDSYTSPGGGVTQLQYNRDHQVTAINRPDGGVITNTYDSAGRVAAVSTPSGVYGLTYSGTSGNPETITGPSGITTRYTYDGFLPLTITWSGAVNGSVAMMYDADFRVASKKIGNAASINFGYDGDGLLTSAGIETITRDPSNGRVTGAAAGFVSDSLDYDEFGQLSDYVALLNSAAMFSEHYTRDVAGRITAIDETSGGTTTKRAFAYDDAGRLAIVMENGAQVASYNYDVNSNRLARITSSGTDTGSYDDEDRVVSYGGYTFGYTANGEIASKTGPGGATSYQYDSFGNLVGVTLPNGHAIEYVLDGRQRRVAKRVDGAITQKFLYSDGLRPIAQLAPDDTVVYQFLYAERSNVPSLIIGASSTYRVIANHLGSPRGIIDVATGASLQYLDYDEFGNVTTDTNPGFQPYGFAGGLYDPDTHLVHFGARDYDPALGRFLTRDPLGFGGGQTNVYDYSANDPINLIDPTGMMIGDKKGGEAQTYWVDRYTDPNARTGERAISLVLAAFASLYTPCTSDKTFNVLLLAGTAGSAAPALAAEDLAAEEIAANAPVVIGENVARTGAYAEEIGGETIQDWLAGREWTPELNEEYIEAMKGQGREILDIGPDFEERMANRIDPTTGRAPSQTYGTERNQLLDYDNYRSVFQRTGPFQGGVPGFDF